MTFLTEPRPSVLPGAPRLRLPAVGWEWAYVLAVPLLLALFASRGFFFDRPGWLDPFMYVGYFRHYPEHLPFLESYYKVSRLPWVLPGFVSYRLFGPLVGTYVLQLGTLAFALLCLYGAVRRSLDERVAVLAAVVLGTCTAFHGSGGWNYHNGIATAYFLATVFCLDRAAAGGRPRAWYFLAGAALAATVLTNLFMAAFGPGLVLHYLLTRRAAGRWSALTDVPAGAAGLAALVGGLCLVHRASGGPWLFFMPQIDYTLWLAKAGNTFWKPAGDWLPVAYWLILPAAAVLSCPLAWLLGRPCAGPGGRGLAVLGYQVQGLLAVAVCCYYQFARKQTVLAPDYMAACLLGPAVLALAAFFYAVRDRLAGVSVHRVALAGLALFAVPLLATNLSGRLLLLDGLRGLLPVLGTWPVLLPLGLTVAGLVLVAVRRQSAAAWLLGLALMSAANLATALSDVYSARGPRLSRDTFHVIVEADAFASRLDPSLVDIKYWFDSRETIAADGRRVPTGEVFNSFVSTRGWGGNLFGGFPIPEATRIETQHIANVHRIGVLSATANREKYAEQLQARFAQLGYVLRPGAHRAFRHGELDVTLAVFRIEAGGSRAASN